MYLTTMPSSPVWPHYHKHQHSQKIICLNCCGSVENYKQGREIKLTEKSQRLSITVHLMNQFQGWETTQKLVDFNTRFFFLKRLFTLWQLSNAYFKTEEGREKKKLISPLSHKIISCFQAYSMSH